MEHGVQGLITTIISNILLVVLGSVYLLSVKKPLKSGTVYQHSSLPRILFTVYKVSDIEIAAGCGLNAIQYLLLLKYLSWVLFIYSLIGILGLLPLYNSQPLPVSSSMSEFSIEAMENGDIALLAPGLCSIFFSLGIYFISYIYSKIPSELTDYYPTVIYK
jgi:Late exocytosis, associated with Golgi transport